MLIYSSFTCDSGRNKTKTSGTYSISIRSQEDALSDLCGVICGDVVVNHLAEPLRCPYSVSSNCLSPLCLSMVPFPITSTIKVCPVQSQVLVFEMMFLDIDHHLLELVHPFHHQYPND
eukprot:748892_1